MTLINGNASKVGITEEIAWSDLDLDLIYSELESPVHTRGMHSNNYTRCRLQGQNVPMRLGLVGFVASKILLPCFR